MSDLSKIIAVAVTAALEAVGEAPKRSRRVSEKAPTKRKTKRSKAKSKRLPTLDITELLPQVSENRYGDKAMLEFLDNKGNVRNVFKARNRSGYSPFKSLASMQVAATAVSALKKSQSKALAKDFSTWSDATKERANAVGAESKVFSWGAVRLSALYTDAILDLEDPQADDE